MPPATMERIAPKTHPTPKATPLVFPQSLAAAKAGIEKKDKIPAATNKPPEMNVNKFENLANALTLSNEPTNKTKRHKTPRRTKIQAINATQAGLPSNVPLIPATEAGPLPKITAVPPYHPLIAPVFTIACVAM